MLSVAKALKRNSLVDKINLYLSKESIQGNLDRAGMLIDHVGFHPSQIGACLRSVFYGFCGVPMDSNPPQPKTMRIFHNGDYYHERMQKYFRNMGILWGLWKCRSCGKGWQGLTDTCPHCNAPIHHQKYDEVDFSTIHMNGSCDGIIVMEGIEKKPSKHGCFITVEELQGLGCRLMCIELKSMNSNQFRDLKTPKTEHIAQGNCYMWAFKQDECAFIYECKDNQELKVFIEKKDMGIVQDILDRISLFFHAYWNKKALPPRECSKPEWCAYQKECYIIKRDAKALLHFRETLLTKKRGTSAAKTISQTKPTEKSTGANTGTERRVVDKKSLLSDSAKAELHSRRNKKPVRPVKAD